MKKFTSAALCLALAGPALAQAPAKPAAAKAAPVRPASKPAPKPAAPGLPPAGSEQIATAELAHFGEYQCEFGEVVTVEKTPKNEGYIDVHHKKTVTTMKPVLSSTGAVRLEDVKGRLLMLQIANKSMLMDTKIGQRLVDGCVHEKQREAASRPPSQSLGIEPKKD